MPPKVLRTPTASGQRRGGTGEGTLVSRNFVSELHSAHSLVIWRRVCSSLHELCDLPLSICTRSLLTASRFSNTCSCVTVSMELALEAVKRTNLVYYEQYQHHDITVEGASIDDLPLVPPTRGKKGFKEFFQYIAQISEEDLQAIQTAFMDGNLNLAALPASVRPRDALGDACRLQLIVEEQSNGEKRALKFFHSTVDIPLGLVRSLCENAPHVINYKIAPNSHMVKMAFLKMLCTIRGQQWLTQGLQDKTVRGGEAISSLAQFSASGGGKCL